MTTETSDEFVWCHSTTKQIERLSDGERALVEKARSDPKGYPGWMKFLQLYKHTKVDAEVLSNIQEAPLGTVVATRERGCKARIVSKHDNHL